MADDTLAGALKPPMTRLAQTPLTPRAPVNPTDQAYSQLDAANANVAKAESAKEFLTSRAEEETASQQGRLASGLEEAQRAGTESMRPVQDELHGVDMEAAKSRFEPSKRNIEENVALFSLINVVGFAIGAGGKNHSQQAMAALNGMSEGVNKGDLARYNKEKSTFDTNLNALAKKSSMLSNELQKISVLATRDKEEAQLKLQSLFAREHADFLKQYTEQRGLAAGLAFAQQNAKAAQSTLEKARAHDTREQEARDRLQFAHDLKGGGEGKDQWRMVGASGGKALYVNSRTGEEKLGMTIDPKKGGAGPGGSGAAMERTMSQDVGNAAFNLTQFKDIAESTGKLPGGSVAFANSFKGDLTSDIIRYATTQTVDAGLQGTDALMVNLAYDIASAQTGGRGQLSDQKVKAVVSQFPLDSEPPETQKIKWNALFQRVDAANKTLPPEKQIDIEPLRPIFQKSVVAKTPIDLQHFLSEARKTNPKATDKELTDYYNQKYGH